MASLYIDDIQAETGENLAQGISPLRRDDDLLWLVEMFVQHIMAADGILTRHLGDGQTMVMANTHNIGDRTKTRLEHIASMAVTVNRRRAADLGPLIIWSGNELKGDRAMCLAVRVTTTEHVALTGVFDAGALISSQDAESATDRLYPMVDHYFRLWIHHRAERRRAIEYDTAFNLSGTATAILDYRGRIKHLNAAMRRLTSSADGLRCHDHDGALVATDLASAVRLQVAVRHALTGADDKQSDSLTLVCRRPHSPHDLIVMVSAANCPPIDAGDRIVIIQAIAPDADVGKSIRPVCMLHGLSPAETSLVLHLVNGHTIDTAAKMMRIKTDTARSYLKQIFSKTAISRQVDLIRLMLGSLIRLEPHALTVVH